MSLNPIQQDATCTADLGQPSPSRQEIGLNPSSQDQEPSYIKEAHHVTMSPQYEAPDGGLRAWLTVVGGFFIIMDTWGVFVSFGVFQSYYTAEMQLNPSDIAWIGSSEIFLLFFLGAAAGRLTDAGFFRILVVCGMVLTTLGTFMASLSDTYWQLFLAQGICVGVGNGLLFTPIMTVISTQFHKKRALAIGIATCGAVTGGLIFPTMVRELLPTIGFGWTMRAIGFLQLGTLLVALALVKPRVSSRPSDHLIDWSALKEAEFLLFTIGCFLTYTAAFVPYFFLSTYARDIVGFSTTESLNLLLVLNGVGVIGRLLPSYIADRVGVLNTFIAMTTLSSLALFVWPAVSSFTGLFAWTVFYSLSFGGIQSLSPTALTSLNYNLAEQGTRMGMNFGILGFGALVGPPVGGLLISHSRRGYVDAQLFAAACLAAGTIAFVAARDKKRRRFGLDLWSKL